MMKNRKRNRKRGFDYSSEAIYFVTICTQNHHLWFGNVEDKQMILNDAGSIGWEQVEWLENQYPYFQLHNGVVMPNHVHLLFEIDTRQNTAEQKIKSVSELMGAYKTTVSKQIHNMGLPEFCWQRSFHDIIVRTPECYENIYRYISENPERWDEDVHNKNRKNTLNKTQ